MSESEQYERTELEVSVVYGHRTRRGLVRLKLGEGEHLMPPAKAREMATFLLEAAGAAEGDEAVMRLLDRDGVSLTKAAQFLMALRQERSKIDRESRQAAQKALAFDQYDLDTPTN